jgi:hypothetical protein
MAILPGADMHIHDLDEINEKKHAWQDAFAADLGDLEAKKRCQVRRRNAWRSIGATAICGTLGWVVGPVGAAVGVVVGKAIGVMLEDPVPERKQ